MMRSLCPSDDQELLMLAHGDLAPAWHAAVLRLHVARCPECRGRYDAMVAASLAFSDALRGGGAPARLRGPVWPAALATAHVPLLRWPRIVLPAGTAAVVLVGGAVLVGRTHSGAAVPATAAAAAAAPHLCHGVGEIRAAAPAPTPSALSCETQRAAAASTKAECPVERAALSAPPRPRASAATAATPSPAPHSCE
jgi:hypothetical protein